MSGCIVDALLAACDDDVPYSPSSEDGHTKRAQGSFDRGQHSVALVAVAAREMELGARVVRRKGS
jgi:hypothetical protein